MPSKSRHRSAADGVRRINLVVVPLSINPWRDDRLPDRFPEHRPGHAGHRALCSGGHADSWRTLPRDDGGRRRGHRLRAAGHARQSVRRPGDSDREAVSRRPLGDDWRAGRPGQRNHVARHEDPDQGRAISSSCRTACWRRTPSRITRSPRGECGSRWTWAPAMASPPNEVKAVIREALDDVPAIVHDRQLKCCSSTFAGSAITYRVRFWISDFDADEREDRVRSRIHYALERRHLDPVSHPGADVSGRSALAAADDAGGSKNCCSRCRCSRRSQTRSARTC